MQVARSALAAAQLGEQFDVAAHVAPLQEGGVLEHVAEAILITSARPVVSRFSPEAMRGGIDLLADGPTTVTELAGADVEVDCSA